MLECRRTQSAAWHRIGVDISPFRSAGHAVYIVHGHGPIPAHPQCYSSSVKSVETTDELPRAPWWVAFDQPIEECRNLLPPFVLLLAGLYANTKLSVFHPGLWALAPLLIVVLLLRATYGEAERPVVRLWQWVGVFSAVYSLVHFPLMPVAPESAGGLALYIILLVAWMLSLLSGILCFRVVSLSVLPPAFLLWANLMAEDVTGLRTTIHIDVQPLTEVSMSIGIGLLAVRIVPAFNAALTRMLGKRIPAAEWVASSQAAFPPLLLLIAIAIHLANYFWSFWAKITLDGPPGAWLTENNPAYMYLVALDDGHILYSGYPHLRHLLFEFFDLTHLYTNLFILCAQAAALIVFLAPRRVFVSLLVLFDLMHGAIIVLAGANFWPWIILNIIITCVILTRYVGRPSVTVRILASIFILAAPRFAHIAMLGWYDSGANNKLYFEAVDAAGRRYSVPTNFFTFYSYSFGHMDYGSPEQATAFAVSSPNGGTRYYEQFRAGRTCDVDKLTHYPRKAEFDPQELAAFVRHYHALALAIYARLGLFPYDWYPHHFYVPIGDSADFRRLDMHRIVAYVYRRESVCLDYSEGNFRRQVVSSAEYRIDVD